MRKTNSRVALSLLFVIVSVVNIWMLCSHIAPKVEAEEKTYRKISMEECVVEAAQSWLRGTNRSHFRGDETAVAILAAELYREQ